MTKYDLIKFLEPFDDNIQIVVPMEPDMFGNEARTAQPEYQMAKDDSLKDVGITKGDGYIDL